MASGAIHPLTPELTASLAGEWDELLQDSVSATPFQSRAWVEALLAESQGRARLILIREGEDLIGLFPVRLSFRGWRTARSFGVGPSDYLHPLARTGRENEVTKMVQEHLRSLPVDLLDLHQIRGTAESLPYGSGEPQAKCLVIDLPPDFEAYKRRLGKSLRTDVNRGLRDASLTIERARPEDLDRHLETFLRLHRARWRARGLPGAFGARAVRLQQRWTADALERGWLRLSTLIKDGAPIGSLYAMTLGTTRYFYQAGMEPSAKAVSPGTVLIADSIREAITEGQFTFDMMRGAEGYKRRWMPDREETNLRFLTPLNPLGQVGAAVARRSWQVESLVRERLEGGTLVPRRAAQTTTNGG